MIRVTPGCADTVVHRVLPVAGLLTATLAAAGCGSSSSSAPTDAATAASAPSAAVKTTPTAVPAKAKASATKVDIKDFDYSPKSLTVKIGAKVTWTNRDEANHTVTFDTGAKQSLGNQGKGKAVSFSFKKAGTFAYHCDFHPNMHGTVVVG